ncbi:MAG TPA: hypothetical protein VNC50_21205, partial [Planctomycetia bacterium]|nr:hypothetical protein [Planctomycetia bacterium]
MNIPGADDWSTATREWVAATDARLESPAGELGADLDFIEEGIRLRRRAGEETDPERRRAALRSAAGALFRVQNSIARRLREAPPSPGSAAYVAVAERLQRFLAADRVQLERLAGRPGDRVRRALRLERLRGDLHWREQLAAVLEAEQPPHAIYHVRTSLDGVAELIGPPVPGEPADVSASRSELLAKIDSLRERTLANRANSELSAAIDEEPPAALWRRRYAMTRLESEVRAAATPAATALAARLAERRRSLAEFSRSRLAESAAAERTVQWRELDLVAEESAIEIVAGLDALAPEHGFLLLGAVAEDVEALSQIAVVPPDAGEAEREAVKSLQRRLAAQRRDVRNS